MYKLFFLFFVSFLSAQQKCSFSFSNNHLSSDGTITLTIKNIGKKRTKVPKKFSLDFARPTDIQIYNFKTNSYVDTGYSFDGASCLNSKKCFGKMTYLKKNDSIRYEIKTIHGRISKALKSDNKYRFKLAFDTYLFSNCNDFVTDWLYYDNK